MRQNIMKNKQRKRESCETSFTNDFTVSKLDT